MGWGGAPRGGARWRRLGEGGAPWGRPGRLSRPPWTVVSGHVAGIAKIVAGIAKEVVVPCLGVRFGSRLARTDGMDRPGHWNLTGVLPGDCNRVTGRFCPTRKKCKFV